MKTSNSQELIYT